MDKAYPLSRKFWFYQILSPWEPLSLLMLRRPVHPPIRLLHVSLVRLAWRLWAHHVATYAERGLVCAQVWRLCNRQGCEWDSSFSLFMRKLCGSRHTYSWLWFSAGKIKPPSSDKGSQKSVLCCLVSIVSALTTPYVDNSPTIQPLKSLILTYF